MLLSFLEEGILLWDRVAIALEDADLLRLFVPSTSLLLAIILLDRPEKALVAHLKFACVISRR